jgi:hypothetical protein
MLFTEGDRCANGQRRTAHVFVSCRTDDHLPKDRSAGDSMVTTLSVYVCCCFSTGLRVNVAPRTEFSFVSTFFLAIARLSSVSEPETCVYHMTLSMPKTSYLCNVRQASRLVMGLTHPCILASFHSRLSRVACGLPLSLSPASTSQWRRRPRSGKLSRRRSLSAR